MTAANDRSDSDQSGCLEQRPWLLAVLLTVAAALVLGGCAGNASRSGTETTARAGDRPAAYPGSALVPAADTIPPEPEPADGQIWSRLRRGFMLGDIRHPRIEQEIRRLQRSPRGFLTVMARAEPYIHYIIGEIEAAGLPSELALLPAVESGFRPHVYSPDGAAGLWQFMPATGHMLGLRQDWWFDKRRSVRASTRAAITYLQRLNRRFSGDWLQTLAAYNAGAGTVGKAIRRAGRRGEDTDFWSLDLPGETDRYVPHLLALAAIVADPEAYGMELPAIADQPYFATAATGGQIDLNVAARLASMPVEDLLTLNAGHKRWASRPDGPHELLLPVDRVEGFEQRILVLPPDQRLRWQRYRIQRGDSLNRIARRFGVTVEAIRRSNGLRDSRIRAGKDLLIPLSDSVTPGAAGSNRQARQRLRYRVRKGDSLYTIARRFQVSVTDLKRWNRVGRYIRPGEKLTVFIDPDA